MPAPPTTVLRIALPLPLPREFDYLAPTDTAAGADWIGCRVRVPFGRGEQIGIVSGVGPAEADGPALKPVSERLDTHPLLAGELLNSLRWLASYYQAPLGEVLATALPTALRAGAECPDTAVYAWRLRGDGPPPPRRGSRAATLWQTLKAGNCSEAELRAAVPGARALLEAWQDQALAERFVISAVTRSPHPGPVLNDEQRAAITALRGLTGFQPILLEGVTGSGKTEVYLQAIQDCLDAGRQALVLVPEIGLTPQTLRRFRERLGVEVLALHSGLADGERARHWLAMARGHGRVMVGTRSAVFCPLPEAGLIIVDEEHDASYKQQDGVRYSARDVALKRAQALQIPALLGSATPSLESLNNAEAGRFLHLRLRQRAGAARAPAVRVLDLRKRRLSDGLCEEVFTAVAACLARGEQALVFKNRRGYAPVLICHDCGWSAQCKRCSTPTQGSPMTVYGTGRGLRCHHCGGSAQRPLSCPDCASLALQPQGQGTERLEQALAERFPDATRVRIDSDTTRIRDGLQKKLDELGEGPGIIIGTQMLAKGHDLPRLTLVVVVGIDEGLFSADFRAGEKLAQLLIQVAGRAGRGEHPGEVLLQTHHPEHPLLTTLLSGGYPAAARLALAEREAAAFPPFHFLALLRAEAPHESAVMAFLQEARDALLALGFETAGVEAGPTLPAPMPRRAGRARGQLLLSAAQRPALQAALGQWWPRLYGLPGARKVRWSLDVDPVDLY